MNKMVDNLVMRAITAQLDAKTKVTADHLLKEDLGLPSIKLVMLLTDVTIKLGISIMDFTDYELLRLKTVGDLIDLLTVKKDSYEND